MVYKVMIAGDLHKRTKDISTIRGYSKACKHVQLDIMDTIQNEGITHFISLGDWFDGGYGSDVAAALVHTDIDRDMSRLLHGNFYGLIGNHIRIKMDSNPELFLIQPHPVYTSRHEVNRDEQIIKTPDTLVLNGVEFILKHWNPVADNVMDYSVNINLECKHHIALFHTEQVIPAQLLSGMNMGYTIANESRISQALNGVDVAIVGHIHKAIGAHVIKSTTGGKDTLLIVPGSLTNTDAGTRARHEYIDIPIFTIYEDGTFQLDYHRQSLHTEELTFFRKVDEEDIGRKLKSLNGNTKDTLYDDMTSSAFIGEQSAYMSLNTFFERQGYTEDDKLMIRSIMKSPEDIDTLVYIHLRKDDGL